MATEMPGENAGTMAAPRSGARQALLSKEWHEQRWRFALGTIVLSGTLAGLLRAQIIPAREAALLVYWMVGVVLAIFMAMGPVAAERSDRTWEFLVARPVSRGDLLLAKWTIALLQFVAMQSIATLAGLAAMWSRGFSGACTVADTPLGRLSQGVFSLSDLSTHPAGWLTLVAICATASLACWFTPLFFILARARNEFFAGLAGILLTIVLHAWLLIGLAQAPRNGFAVGWAGVVNPMVCLVVALSTRDLVWLPALLALNIAVWIVLPAWLVRRFAEPILRS